MQNAQIYGINKNEESKRFLNSIVEVGTVSVAAKSALNAFKAIPGINLGASVVNAIIAGSIVAALGEGTIYAFEQVYLGKISVADINWVKEMMESKLSSQFIDVVKIIADKATNITDSKAIANIIEDVFKKSFNVPDAQKI